MHLNLVESAIKEAKAAGIKEGIAQAKKEFEAKVQADKKKQEADAAAQAAEQSKKEA